MKWKKIERDGDLRIPIGRVGSVAELVVVAASSGPSLIAAITIQTTGQHRTGKWALRSRAVCLSLLSLLLLLLVQCR